MNRYLTCLLLVSALFTAAAQSRTRAELPAQAQVVEGNAAAQAASAEDLAALHAAMREGTAKRLLRDDPLQFEGTAARLLQTLADAPPSNAERKWVESLLDHQPMLWRQHPETLSAWFIPVFDLAAQAEALQHHWRLQDKLASVLPEMERLQTWTRDLMESPEPVQALVLQGLTPASFDRLLQQPVPPGLGTLTWRTLLRDQRLAEVWQQALVMAPDDALRSSMRGIWRLDAQLARDWLERARAQRPALASVAVAALSDDPNTDLRWARLFELLGSANDHQAAAAALAADTELPDAALIEAFGAVSAGRSQRALALSLRLRDTSTTRRFLADWHEADQGDAALRESLR